MPHVICTSNNVHIHFCEKYKDALMERYIIRFYSKKVVFSTRTDKCSQEKMIKSIYNNVTALPVWIAWNKLSFLSISLLKLCFFLQKGPTVFLLITLSLSSALLYTCISLQVWSQNLVVSVSEGCSPASLYIFNDWNAFEVHMWQYKNQN